MNAIVSMQTTAVAQPATAQEIKAHVQRIQQVMKAVMKDGTHYGKIPGAGDRKSLFKPGAEVLCTTFRIAPSYRVEDLSDHDSIRYRVTCVGTHQASGTVLGEGMGEASSNEEKYKWRNAVCDEEFEEGAEDRKRTKWQKGYNNSKPYQRKQMRSEPADIANTVLKMACKRAQVAMAINVTAASDIFTQDLEDIPPEMRDMADDTPATEGARGKPATEPPKSKGGNGIATEKQRNLVSMKLEQAGISAEDLCKHLEINSIPELPFSKVNDALAWISENAG